MATDPVVYDRFNPPPSAGVDCSGDPGYTQQEFRDEVDINRIMGRVAKGGELPPDVKVGSYGDFSNVTSFQEAMELVKYSENQFNALPARVRERFQNDPAKFLAWIESPETTLEEANELGLLKEEAAKRLADQEAVAAAKARVDAAELEQFRKGEQVKVSTLKTS